MMEILLRVLTLAGALGLFVYGMKVMSEGIQRAAGTQLRSILRAMTRNRVVGLTNGFLITSLVQSSSAVTVLTVGLVNAGLLTVLESMAFVMGANIGTTITGWIVSVLGFRVKLHLLSLPMIALALPMIFSTRGRWPFWGQTLIGLALLFLGLEYLREGFPDLSAQPGLLAFLRDISELGWISVLLYLLAGALLTALVQSSSALMALVLVMSANGWLSFPQAAALLLGANIGTTITANLAAVVGNVFARQTGLFHLLFNVIGALWMLPALGLFLRGVDWFCQVLFGNGSAFSNQEAMPLALSAFHTAFNLVNALVLLFFIPLLLRLLRFLLPVRQEEKPEFHLAYLDSSVGTPELNLFEVQKATGQLGEKVAAMLRVTRMLFLATAPNERIGHRQHLQEQKTQAAKMAVEIQDFLGRLATRELSRDVSLRVSLYQRVCRELERIAEVNLGLTRILEQKVEENAWFTPQQRERQLRLFDLTAQSLEFMQQYLVLRENDSLPLHAARIHRDQLQEWLRFMNDEHLQTVEKEDYHIPSGLIYTNMTSSLQRINDHAFNVAEALGRPS